MRVNAHFDIKKAKASRRGTERRKLRLTTKGSVATGEVAQVLIRDISSTGLLLETSVPLSAGETIDVELPEAPNVRAKVVWSSHNLFGCQFSAPLPRSVLSASQLLSRPERAARRATRELEAAPNEPVADVGSSIRRWRKEQGLTVAQFAEIFGVSRPTVWAWESGKSRPRRSMLDKLSQHAGLLDRSATFPPRDEIDDPEEDTSGEQASADQVQLAQVVSEAKIRVAAAAGTEPDKVRLIVEL